VIYLTCLATMQTASVAHFAAEPKPGNGRAFLLSGGERWEITTGLRALQLEPGRVPGKRDRESPMRTISFNIDGADATDNVAAILLSLPVVGSKSARNGVKFDRDGDTFTVAWRREPSLWIVSFRPVGDDYNRVRKYRSPVDAAHAVIDRRHNEHGTPEYREHTG
jgi:hypothetical protein